MNGRALGGLRYVMDGCPALRHCEFVNLRFWISRALLLSKWLDQSRTAGIEASLNRGLPAQLGKGATQPP